MFIGHFSVGMAAKSIKPSLSLGTYFLAVQFVDLLWPVLLLFNVEQVIIEPGNTAFTPLNFIHYPVTHSLLMAIVWAVAGFGLVYLFKKDAGAGIVVGLCVASHWFLDFLTHGPDLPLTLSEATKVGLGLWNYRTSAFLVETGLFVAGIFMYLRSTIATDRVGKLGFWGLIAFLLLISISNMVGPPPPSVAMIAWAGNLQWLIIVWAYWVDTHRKVRES